MRYTLFLFAVLMGFGAPQASAERRIEFVSAPGGGDALIVGLQEGSDFTELQPIMGDEAFTNLQRAVKQAGYSAKPGKVKSFLTGAASFGEVHLIGLGEAPLTQRVWENFGGRAAKAASTSKAERVAIFAEKSDSSAASHIAFGASLGQYAFNKYKSGGDKGVDGSLAIVTSNTEVVQNAYNNKERHVADAVIWTRNIISEPGGAVYPEEFVTRTRAAFRGVPNTNISVLNANQMQKLGMGALVGVGKGSVRPPRLLVVRYNGGASGDAPLVFAGKGITFDTGGISLKSNSGMWRMKYDMSGAAASTGAVLGLAKSRAPVNVIVIAALAENMPSGGAQRPGDVVKTMSGKTIEILSTDAEGRLVLADAVWYAQQQFKPALLVDLATLTGSVRVALSDEYAGLFARDDDVANKLIKAAKAAGEDLWRLPLHESYYDQIKSDIADIKNSGAGNPGAGVGAAVIGTFVNEETPWAHLDIAGMAWRTEATPTTPKGAAGFGVRLLDQLARDHVAE